MPNFKSVDEKLPELEPRKSHSFVIKIVSRKKLLKVLAPTQTYFRWNFSVSKSRCVYEISQYFFAILKLYFWSIHMAKNLILAISFGFKLNSNLNCLFVQSELSFSEWKTTLKIVVLYISPFFTSLQWYLIHSSPIPPEVLKQRGTSPLFDL